MKKILFILISILLLSCSLDDGNPIMQPSPEWNLINITGGVAGTETVLERGQITWLFNEVDSTLIIKETIQDLPDGLDEGTHSYFVKNIANEDFIFIDDIEYGAIRIGTNTFTIDQNIISTGTASDLYIFRFVR